MKRILAHTVWECKFHIVWVPKRRRKIVFGKLRKELGTIIRRLCKYKGIEIIEGSMSYYLERAVQIELIASYKSVFAPYSTKIGKGTLFYPHT